MKNRNDWQQLATDRLQDANILIDNQRWHAAYYLAGYAVECALKSCILRFVENNTGIIFETSGFSQKCWTHNYEVLTEQADLEEALKQMRSHREFDSNWRILTGWTEKSRYDPTITESKAKELYTAIVHDPDGVLKWLQIHW